MNDISPNNDIKPCPGSLLGREVIYLGKKYYIRDADNKNGFLYIGVRKDNYIFDAFWAKLSDCKICSRELH